MATVNLGRVGLVLKGEWDSATAYTALDVVSHDGNAWAAKQNSTNVEPTTDNSDFWQLFSNNESLVSTVQGYKNDAASSASAAAASASAAASSAQDGADAIANEANMFSAAVDYATGQYVIYNDGTNKYLYRFNADHPAGAWIGTDAARYTATDEFPLIRQALGTKANAAEVAELKSAIAPLVSVNEEFIGHYDNSFPGQIAGNVYKSNLLEIPADAVLKTVKFYSRNATPSVQGYLYLLDSSNKIIDKMELTPSAVGWNTKTINKAYPVAVRVALSGATIGLTYTSTLPSKYYSNGLYEANSTERTKGIGETITFAQNVPERYYEFGFELAYEFEGSVDILSNRVDTLESETATVDLSSFAMPRCIKVDGQYTLIGRWFNHMLDTDRFKNCCNCGGQSIMFKVKSATTINANFGQVSRYPDNENYLMENEPYMAYSIDGSAFTRVQLDTTNGNSISVSDTNEHFVWIVIDGMDMNTKNGTNRDTGWIGVYVKSITSDGTLYAIEPKNKQILFVGDSMVEGINTLGTDSKAPSNSAVNEFSIKTAQRLNAIPLLNGYGGTTTWSGVNWVRYSFGTTDTNVTTMEPDLIAIEYGHNDYSLVNGGTRTEAEFIAQYELLISILRGMYTGVPIICIIPFHQRLVEQIQQAASAYDFCYVIPTADYTGITYSDGTHPNSAGATAIAEQLSNDIVKIMGKAFFVS